MANLTIIKNRIDITIRIFLYILIFWLPYSPAVIESCVIISLLLWILKRAIMAYEKKVFQGKLNNISAAVQILKPESSFLNTPIALFLLACLLSVTCSAFFAQSVHNFLTKTMEWFVVYFLVIETFKTKKHITIAIIVFVFTAFSTAIDSLIQYYITYKDIFLGHTIEPGGRANAGFKTSNGLGGYLAGIIPGLTAWVLLAKQNKWIRLSATLILSVMVWSLSVTFSRGAWIGTLFGIFFLLFYILFPGKRKNIYLSLGLLSLVALSFVAFVLILAYGQDQSFLERYETIHWRLGIWSVSLKMIKDKLFFGHGINTFMSVFQAYRANSLGPTYAHNCYIQLAAEIGLVGLLCFFWIVAQLFHRTLGILSRELAGERNVRALTIGLLSGTFAYFIHSFFDTNIYSLQLSVYLWLMIAMLIAVSKMPVSEKNAGS